MKRLFNKLKSLGKLDIVVDYHKLFNETAMDVIDRTPIEYAGCPCDKMKSLNTIIRVEFAPNDKPMAPAVSYHWDVEEALKRVHNEYLLWQPKNS